MCSPTTPQRDAKRALVVLRAAEQFSSRQIAVEVAMHESHVANWRRRFLAERIAGLSERKHTGRPRRLGHDERLAMAAAATAEKSADDAIAAGLEATVSIPLFRTDRSVIEAVGVGWSGSMAFPPLGSVPTPLAATSFVVEGTPRAFPRSLRVTCVTGCLQWKWRSPAATRRRRRR